MLTDSWRKAHLVNWIEQGTRFTPENVMGNGTVDPQRIKEEKASYGTGRSALGEEYGSSGTSDYGRTTLDLDQGMQEPYGEFQHSGPPRDTDPENLERSDDRITELLCERLHDDPDLDASEVIVSVQGGRIKLEGTVDSLPTRKAVENVAEQFGVQDLQSDLRVRDSSEPDMHAAVGDGTDSTRQG